MAERGMNGGYKRKRSVQDKQRGKSKHLHDETAVPVPGLKPLAGNVVM